MRELSLHVLDIVQNSIVANASVISIIIDEQIEKDRLNIIIEDDGKGMNEETLKRVQDPFYTSRTTRKVGLGVPLFKLAAELSGGSFIINSKMGEGTKVEATFVHSHIDRQPIGDMKETMMTLLTGNNDIDFIYKHTVNKNEFLFDTRQIKEVLGEIDVNIPEIYMWISEYISEGIMNLYGG